PLPVLYWPPGLQCWRGGGAADRDSRRFRVRRHVGASERCLSALRRRPCVHCHRGHGGVLDSPASCRLDVCVAKSPYPVMACLHTFPQDRLAKIQSQQNVLVEILRVKVLREQIYAEKTQRLIQLHEQSDL